MRGDDRINLILPDDLIQNIFRHLDSNSSRDACSLVCKRWLSLERLSRDTIKIGASGIPDALVKLFARRFVNVRSVSINEHRTLFTPYFGRRHDAYQSALSWLRLHFVTDKSKSGDNETESHRLSDAGLAAVADGFTKLEELTLISCSNATCTGLRSIAERCRSLKSLHLQGGYVGDQGLAAVGECCKQLEFLNLDNCEGLTDTGLVDLALGCGRTLKSLVVIAAAKITDVSLEAVGSHCISLESFLLSSDFIHDKGVVAVAKGCPLLKVLNVGGINFTDEAFAAVGIFSLSLELLVLHRCRRVTDKSLCAVGKGCKLLKSLKLRGCPLLSDKGLEAVAVGCPELAHLELNACFGIGTYGLKCIGKSCMRLTELALLYCQKIGDEALSEVGSGCKDLQALQLQECSSISNDGICSIARGCRNLKRLHISGYHKIGSKGLIAVGENCKYLTHLNIKGYRSIGDDAFVSIGHGCPRLQNLNISGCDLIGDTGIIAVARGCPQLSYMDIQNQKFGDKALVKIGEGCPLLKVIHLSHSRQITDFGLALLVKGCKLLEVCHMIDCPGITKVGVATVMSSCVKMKRVRIEDSKVSARTRRQAGSIIINWESGRAGYMSGRAGYM